MAADKGLKENVIVGRLIPAGTGATKIRWNKAANERDIEFLSKKKSEISDNLLKDPADEGLNV